MITHQRHKAFRQRQTWSSFITHVGSPSCPTASPSPHSLPASWQTRPFVLTPEHPALHPPTHPHAIPSTGVFTNPPTCPVAHPCSHIRPYVRLSARPPISSLARPSFRLSPPSAHQYTREPFTSQLALTHTRTLTVLPVSHTAPSACPPVRQ